MLLRTSRRCCDDENGARLWKVLLPGDENLVLLELENTTLEHDGSRKRYVLRVPPRMRRARDAWAWTFSLNEGTYALTEQS